MTSIHPRLIKTFCCSGLGTSGSTAVLTALMLPVIVGFLAFGLDTANWYTNNRQIRRVADLSAAATAPYLAKSTYTLTEINAIATNVALLNGMSTAGTDTLTVTVSPNRSTLTVAIARKLNRFFSAMFVAPPTTTASATAGSSSNSVCILTVSPTASRTFLVDPGAQLTAPGCEIDVASTNTNGAIFDVALPGVSKICVAGGTKTNGLTMPNLQNQCSVASDPYTQSIPIPATPVCTVNGGTYGPGVVNLSPGVYCGHFNWNGPGTINLSPGLYVLEDDWTVSGNFQINGSGVTFYFFNNSSYVDFAGSNVNLSAPTSGTYANILMFEGPGLSHNTSNCSGDGCFNLTGTSTGNSISGVVHLPSRNVLIASGAISSSLTLVTYTLELASTMNWSMQPNTNTIKSNGVSSTSLSN